MSAFRCLLLATALGLLGCLAAHAPLGDDWDGLSPAARDARALEALDALFRGEGTGAALDGRDGVVVDLAGVSYRTALGAARLRWEDIESVQGDTLEDVPARPETLRLYLRDDSPSAETALDRQQPLLASVGLARDYVVLHRRPRWSRVRLLAALDHLRERREQGGVAAVTSRADVAAVDSPVTAAASVAAVDSQQPGPAELDDLEAKLLKLKRWHAEGLITPEEYDEKRRELLSGM